MKAKHSGISIGTLVVAAAVEEARLELGVLIEAEKMGREVDLFWEFSTCWERFRQIDQELLPLSVLNTNLKAYALSFDSDTGCAGSSR